MRVNYLRAPRMIILLFTLLLISMLPFANVYSSGQVTSFTSTPIGYNSQTGAFRLESQIIKEGHKLHSSGSVCVTFDYFIFTAQAGQALQGQVTPGSTGSKPVYYSILSSPIQLNQFQNSACGRGWLLNGFTSPSTIDWTAPADGQYALVFIITGFYGGVVYFMPS